MRARGAKVTDVVVLVADPALGAINAVRLSALALAGPWETVVVLNRFERDLLKDALAIVNQFRDLVRYHFNLKMF